MATTTNFGWETPDDTDLVKDGAAAIRTSLNGVDASFVDLKGGTSGQVLAKNSATDLDFIWVAQDDSNAIQNAIVDAKGDLIAATANDTPARLGVGTNGQVLTADSAESTGLKWATPSAGANEALGYKWNMWNPTNNTGTETNAPSSGTSSGNTTNISLANSSGTVTLTLGAGTYLVSCSSNAIITAAYTYAALLNYVGGTATSYLATKASPNNYISQWGEGDQSGDFALSTSFIVTATASQTVTILPKGRTSGAGTTDKYEYYATLTIVRM